MSMILKIPTGINDLKLSTEFAHSGKQSYRMDEASEFSPGFDMKCFDLKKGKGKIKVKVSVYVLSQLAVNTDVPALVVSLDDSKKSYDYNTLSFRSMNLVLNQWNHLEKEVQLVQIQSPTEPPEGIYL